MGVVTCHAYPENTLFTANSRGQIAQWDNDKMSVAFSKTTHEGCIYSMFQRQIIPGIITGGRDGLIKVWAFNEVNKNKFALDIDVDKSSG